MTDYNEYLLNFYYFMTEKLYSIRNLLKKGDLKKRDLYRYILVSRCLQRLENYDTSVSNDHQEFDIDTYIEIQSILNIYLETNIIYYEFVYN